ncbi:MAG: hypothetical protein H8E53_09225 [Planctomycetes bacterium]|nr:hypothetical protein [Planctomycetota bacterium]
MKYASLVLATMCLTARADVATLQNPLKTPFSNEAARLAVDAGSGPHAVKIGGKEIPCQLDDTGRLWVLTSLDAGATGQYTVEKRSPAKFKSAVSAKRQGDFYVLDNGKISVRLPVAAGKTPPCPIAAVTAGGKWVGAGVWNTKRKLSKFTATLLGDGPVFARARLRYEFEGTAGLYRKTPAFAQIDVTVFPGQHHAVITESHEMDRGDYWELDCAAGWSPRGAMCIPHSNGFDRQNTGPWPPNSLKFGQTRMGETMINLMPRWTQAYDEGWFFACHDDKIALGAMVVRAGRWYWPHNNMIAVKVRKSADYAGLRCPTWKGRREWFLLAGPKATWAEKAAKQYVTRHAFVPLDKLNNDYILDWPGLEKSLSKSGAKRKPKLGGFRGKDFFHSGMNPTSGIRGFGRAAVRDAGKPGNLETLTLTQVMFDIDCYGSYWNFWSPENPNFFTDFMRGPIAMTSRLKAHPRFRELAKVAERKFREDLYHSITLPGGAGQECPGYIAHAMKSWSALAPLCKEHLGFDPTQWPRYRAGVSFLVHLSQPIAPGKRRCHPGGDTHPLGPDVFAVAEKFGVKEDVREFKSEELPGFGVVFRNAPGSDKEMYLAFKSGPNRGHFHGDQLSFHYCAEARQVAIDHMCSYGPRAGQEHMHNRVAFHTDKLPWANMDGYERVIAFKTSADVDVAIGQVESDRLRVTTEYPPEGWDVYLPQQKLDKTLKYRRTIVAIKNAGRDYFVIRDQHNAPEGVKATYCLHVLSNECERKDNRLEFGNLTAVCVKPAKFTLARHDWKFEKTNKKTKQTIIREHSRGIRLTDDGAGGEFITVLYPGNKTPEIEAVDGGVRVGDDVITFGGGIDDLDAETYVNVARNRKAVMTLTGKDIDMDRSQGEVGLFVPDAGYPFGVIPDWLIRQRIKVPDWESDRVKAMRAGGGK